MKDKCECGHSKSSHYFGFAYDEHWCMIKSCNCIKYKKQEGSFK